MPTRTLRKILKLCFRVSENQKMKVRRPPKNHQKSMKKPLRKHVDKKSPKFVQNGSTWGPTWLPRGDFISGVAPLGAQLFSFSCFCRFWGPLGAVLGPSWGHLGTILGPFCVILEPMSFFVLFVLFVVTSLTSLSSFNGPADCAKRLHPPPAPCGAGLMRVGPPYAVAAWPKLRSSMH